MLQKVSIQNFKSLKDVTLDLQKVNLLIGPNNSGKSNFLKALRLLANYIQGDELSFDSLIDSYHKKILNGNAITFTYNLTIKEISKDLVFTHSVSIFNSSQNKALGYSELIGFLNDGYSDSTYDKEDVELLNKSLRSYELVFNSTNIFYIHNPSDYRKLQRDGIIENSRKFHISKNEFENFITELKDTPDFGKLIQTNILHSYNSSIVVEDFVNHLLGTKLYGINPAAFTKPSLLNRDVSITESASNLVSFLDNIKEENPSIFNKIEQDLHKCIPEFKHITLPKTKAENGYIEKKIKLLDKDENGFWADEVSEGVLYFLALLCIVHQPNPPKLLLLEEPEKGIHPRRIKEVLDFIFQLAEDKDIQVIMTTHSERVLDEFEDIPEAVFIFDKDEEGATQVKNLLKDVIEPSNQKMEAKGLPKIKFTDSLGSHWVTGFIGGVPR